MVPGRRRTQASASGKSGRRDAPDRLILERLRARLHHGLLGQVGNGRGEEPLALVPPAAPVPAHEQHQHHQASGEGQQHARVAQQLGRPFPGLRVLGVRLRCGPEPLRILAAQGSGERLLPGLALRLVQGGELGRVVEGLAAARLARHGDGDRGIGLGQHVGRGVGVTVLPIRIDAPPEIPIVTLRRRVAREPGTTGAGDAVDDVPSPFPSSERV